MNERRKQRTTILLAALAAGLLAACQPLPYANDVRIPTVVQLEDGSPERAAMNVRVHDAVMRTVERNFYDRTFNAVDFQAEVAARREATLAQPDERGFYESLNATLDLLNDGHTMAIRPSVNLAESRRVLETAPTFGLFQAVVTDAETGEKLYFVTRVQTGSPADEAGVKPGWRILTIDGEPWDKPWEEGRPFAGLTFVIGFEDSEGKTYDIPLESRLMSRELGMAERRPDGVLVLRFYEFDEATADWLEDRLAEARVDPPRGIVLDVRANGGGEVKAGARVLGGLFREPFVFAHYRGILGPIAHRSRRVREVWDGPLAVVQSGHSGSMSEILAAAVQEQRRGPVVGQKSAGVVVAAWTFGLPDGGQLRVGVSEFRTGGGVVLERAGVTPDIFSEPTYEDVRTGRDAMMETAVQALLDGWPGTVAQ